MNSTVNTLEMQRRVRAAAKRKLNPPRPLETAFEHGQWWVYDPVTGAQWSVVDAEGPNTVDGFDFEQVTEGEE